MRIIIIIIVIVAFYVYPQNTSPSPLTVRCSRTDSPTYVTRYTIFDERAAQQRFVFDGRCTHFVHMEDGPSFLPISSMRLRHIVRFSRDFVFCRSAKRSREKHLTRVCAHVFFPRTFHVWSDLKSSTLTDVSASVEFRTSCPMCFPARKIVTFTIIHTCRRRAPRSPVKCPPTIGLVFTAVRFRAVQIRTRHPNCTNDWNEYHSQLSCMEMDRFESCGYATSGWWKVNGGDRRTKKRWETNYRPRKNSVSKW